MTTAELTAIRELLESSPRPEHPTPALTRERLVRLTSLLAAPVDLDPVPVDAGGVPGIFCSAPGADPSRCIYYLHGGGYVVGSPQTHQILTHELSRASGMRAMSVDYRLAPEHPFPNGLEDAITGYRWLLDSGTDPASVVIAGDSAGGGLAIATLVALRDRNLPLPAAAVCFSPWVDMEGLGDSMQSRVAVDPMVQRDALLTYAVMYLNGADPRDPLASPLYADLAGLPPVLIQVGDAETLLDDAVRLAGRLREAGNDVRLDVWDRMIHVWQLFGPMLSEGRDAIGQAGAFMAARTMRDGMRQAG